MKEDKASKRPWAIHKVAPYAYACAVVQVKDAEDRGVLEIRGRREKAEANARAILDGVNGREAMVALVRRFVGLVNHQAPVLSVFALLDAEEPGWRGLPEGERNAKVNEGHRRLARLMSAAYDAIGGEEE